MTGNWEQRRHASLRPVRMVDKVEAAVSVTEASQSSDAEVDRLIAALLKLRSGENDE